MFFISKLKKIILKHLQIRMDGLIYDLDQTFNTNWVSLFQLI
jgi:hypothetical protein